MLGPARGLGLGRKVMAMAEAEARSRGLAGIWLDTWTFQAPGFYPKLGFRNAAASPTTRPARTASSTSNA